jgi:lysophospholipase L1-like esterase
MSQRGLVAVGDSITEGCGNAMLGLPTRPWTLWLAEALHLRYTSLARSGHRVADVVSEQLPQLAGPYDLGCVYIGVNDVCASNWAEAAFEHDLQQICSTTAAHAGRLLLVNIPVDLGRPRVATSTIRFANAAIERVAASRGTYLLDLTQLRGWLLVLPDGVHLTALGQAHLALLACEHLTARGLHVDQTKLPKDKLQPSPSARFRYACGPYARALASHQGKRGRTWLRTSFVNRTTAALSRMFETT